MTPGNISPVNYLPVFVPKCVWAGSGWEIKPHLDARTVCILFAQRAGNSSWHMLAAQWKLTTSYILKPGRQALGGGHFCSDVHRNVRAGPQQDWRWSLDFVYILSKILGVCFPLDRHELLFSLYDSSSHIWLGGHHACLEVVKPYKDTAPTVRASVTQSKS